MGALGTSLTRHELRGLAATAGCDERTLAKVLRGERISSVCIQRACEEALRKAGFLPAAKEQKTEASL